MGITPVIICGGSGSRLWPISTAEISKPFIPLHGTGDTKRCGLEEMLLLASSPAFNTPTIIGNDEHRALITPHATHYHARVITEPSVKNTLATITLAALAHQNSHEPLLILPTDHYFDDSAAFVSLIRALTAQLTDETIATLGIRPDRPSTEYGYIAYDSSPITCFNDTNIYRVTHFHEKPDLATAQQYVKHGMVFNSGCFLATPGSILRAISAHRPDIVDICTACYQPHNDHIREQFNALPSLSFDREIIEKHDHIITAPYDGTWFDLGSFSGLHHYLRAQDNGSVPIAGITLTADECLVNTVPVLRYDPSGIHYYGYYSSPIGPLRLTLHQQQLTRLEFYQGTHDTRHMMPHPDFTPIFSQLDEYFRGERTDFSIAIAPHGTAFQQSVWQALTHIHYNSTVSYKQIANQIENPKAVRAVGLANNKNPLPIIIPCHRVIGSSGKLTGYAGGLPAKQWLLEHERQSALKHGITPAPLQTGTFL